MTKRQVEYICMTAAAVGLSALITGMAAAEDPQAMAAHEQASQQIEGLADGFGKVITLQMKGTDPLTGKETRMRIVGRWEGDDKLVEKFYEKMAGKEMKTMEITYTRTK